MKAEDLDFTKCTEAEGYESVKKMIYKLCHNFAAYNGGGFDDFLSVACEHWLNAHRAYNPDYKKINPKTGQLVTVKYTTYVQVCVRQGLIDKVRKDKLLRSHFPCTEEPIDCSPAAKGFKLKTLLQEVSEEAALVIRLALLDTSIEDVKKNRCLEAGRASIMKTLIREFGWPARKVVRVFKEVWEALK